jgi:hypothetical protein
MFCQVFLHSPVVLIREQDLDLAGKGFGFNKDHNRLPKEYVNDGYVVKS